MIQPGQPGAACGLPRSLDTIADPPPHQAAELDSQPAVSLGAGGGGGERAFSLQFGCPPTPRLCSHAHLHHSYSSRSWQVPKAGSGWLRGCFWKTAARGGAVWLGVCASPLHPQVLGSPCSLPAWSPPALLGARFCGGVSSPACVSRRGCFHFYSRKQQIQVPQLKPECSGPPGS